MSKRTSQVRKIDLQEKMLGKILIFACVITLYFNTNLEDPFNTPKMWILMAMASWLFLYLFSTKLNGFKPALMLIVFFVSTLLIATLFSAIPYTAFNGAAGRRLGMFTYVSLAIVLLATATYANFNARRFYFTVMVISLILTIYGTLQYTGRDFVNWNNPYNAVILTFGNPNFASAMLAIFASILIGTFFGKSFNLKVKALIFFTVLLMINLIKESDSRQGFITVLIAVLIQISYFVFYKSKILGRLMVSASSILLSVVVLAMLQVGPLTDLIYKRSVSVRGYYWRAAIEMFKDHPWLGVGIDKYGDYFKQYREANYSLNFGFELTSTNAHNVPLQFLATGGILLFVSYMILLAYIFYSGVNLIAKTNGENRNFSISIFAAWVAFQAQSIISIDNIGLTIWGWILGGLLIGLNMKIKAVNSSSNEISSIKNKISGSIIVQLLSYALVIFSVILNSFSYRGETSVLQQRSVYNPANESNRSVTNSLGQQMNKLILIDPNYRFMSSTYLITSGFENIGFKILDGLIKNDPRNLDYLNAKAGYLEQRKSYSEAIKLRNDILQYDPWNARNLLNLGINYKEIGKFPEMTSVLEQIKAFAEENPIYLEAVAKLRDE